MSLNAEDVQEGIVALWNANTTLVAAVPGGLVQGRVRDPIANAMQSPYAVFSVKVAGGATLTCGSAFMQSFTAEFAVWDETGSADLASIKQQLQTTFWDELRAARTVITLPNGNQLQIMAATDRPVQAIDEDPATQQGKAVKIARDAFTLQCQG